MGIFGNKDILKYVVRKRPNKTFRLSIYLSIHLVIPPSIINHCNIIALNKPYVPWLMQALPVHHFLTRASSTRVTLLGHHRLKPNVSFARLSSLLSVYLSIQPSPPSIWSLITIGYIALYRPYIPRPCIVPRLVQAQSVWPFLATLVNFTRLREIANL